MGGVCVQVDRLTWKESIEMKGKGKASFPYVQDAHAVAPYSFC